MATKIVPMLSRKVGHVPLRSFQSTNAKGQHLCSTKINGKEFTGVGDSERLASLDLKRRVELETLEGHVA